MEIKKIGDEYFTFITECRDPKACTILLRGASKEILSVSRSLLLSSYPEDRKSPRCAHAHICVQPHVALARLPGEFTGSGSRSQNFLTS